MKRSMWEQLGAWAEGEKPMKVQNIIARSPHGMHVDAPTLSD